MLPAAFCVVLLAAGSMLVTTSVSVGYESDPDQVIELLSRVAGACERVLADPAPATRLTEFGADGLQFTVYFWIEDPHNGQNNVRSDVNLAVLKALRAAGVEIPYPQRVVHMRAAG